MTAMRWPPFKLPFNSDKNERLKSRLSERFGRYLKKLRKRHGMTQEELSFRSNVSSVYISQLEQGEKHPSLFVCWKISQALSMEFDEFWREF